MKLSVACLASGLPAGVLRAAPWMEKAANNATAPLRAATFDLDDDDVPTTVNVSAFLSVRAAAAQRA
ncbi:MAG: hypothetical protein JNL21_37840 [Myxococcales bacterium]|nr:hypothetical protein [Myxococcales bacterium]